MNARGPFRKDISERGNIESTGVAIADVEIGQKAIIAKFRRHAKIMIERLAFFVKTVNGLHQAFTQRHVRLESVERIEIKRRRHAPQLPGATARGQVREGMRQAALQT